MRSYEDDMNDKRSQTGMNRRSFLQSTAAVGAGLTFSPFVSGQTSSESTDDINVALLGVGEEGYVLMTDIVKIPGVRFKALCDIWDYNRTRNAKILKYYGHEVKEYVDYVQMLAEQKDLDAVIIATPDFWHQKHTCACLEAGLHVYCEKEMSNTLEGARKMVETAKKTGKLLQIGHQRRSNPRYLHCYNKLLKEANLLGHIAAANGQWNRSKDSTEFFGWPEGEEIDKVTLEKYGYKSMEQFRNWRWFKGLGGGPIVDLGSHQIDIFNWFLEARPASVIASGGRDYWKDREWYDTVMAIYEYETKLGKVHVFYQTISTNSAQDCFEQFMGDEGTLVISESSSRGTAYLEKRVIKIEKWEPWVSRGYLNAPEEEEEKESSEDSSAVLDVGQSPVIPYDIPVTMEGKPYHQPHLENFFDAIRGKAKLTCPPEIGYETAVTVLKVNDAIEAGAKLQFDPKEFEL
jgi:predicted dehydrogenase